VNTLLSWSVGMQFEIYALLICSLTSSVRRQRVENGKYLWHGVAAGSPNCPCKIH